MMEVKEEVISEENVADESVEASPEAGSDKKQSKKEKKSKKEIDVLKEKNAELEAKLVETTGLVKRGAADFDNYRKRMATDKQNFYKMALKGILEDLLEIGDNINMAISSGEAAADLNAYKEGVGLIDAKFHSLLEKYEVVKFDSLGEEFDHNLHEALLMEDNVDGDEFDKVSGVMQEGYKIGDMILRHAKVKVARGAEVEVAKTEDEEAEG